jgi:hypothetical protein
MDGKLFRNGNGEIYCIDLFVEEEIRFGKELLDGPNRSVVYVTTATDQENLSKINWFLIVSNRKGEGLFKVNHEDVEALKRRVINWRCSSINGRYYRIEFLGRFGRQSTLA